MRENRPYGLEGGETGLNGLPYPYAHYFSASVTTSRLPGAAATRCSV